MIGKLTGILDNTGEDWVLIDVAGVGYLVHCSPRVLASLPAPGETVSLSIDTYVREDAIRLYGFAHWLERDWFVHLQGVQGVGARVALAILDVLTPGDLSQAVALQDKAAFARASGVGPKLAARIVTELLGRKPPEQALRTVTQDSALTSPTSGAVSQAERREGLEDILLRNDAISALVNLGYNAVSAGQAVASAYASFDHDPPVNDLIKAALKEVA